MKTTKPKSQIISKRQLQVLKLIANGETDKSIGDALKISIHTVGVHRAHIFTKLGANNAVHAVRLAIRKGLIKV